MDRLKYHQERLDAKLGFKRDENFRYDFDPVVPQNTLDVPENEDIVPQNQQKNTQYHLGFQTGATFDVDESYKESNAYKKYMQTRPEALEEAKKISDTTGIPYDAIIEDSESMAKAREIYDYKKKVMDFSKVYERYPELKKLNEADGAISLHNIQDVKRVHGDFEAVKVGWNTDSLWAERNILGLDKFLGKQVDEKKLEELNQKLQELKEIPTLDEDISMAILGNSTQQARMMVRHFIQSLDTVALGATAGAIGNAVLNRNNVAMAPALITGARTALPVAFKTGMAIEMFKESVGSNYLTYTGYKDKFGNQLLTDSEARLYATATALIETGVEFANYGAVIDILKGSKKTIGAAKVIENIVKNSKDTASVMAQLKTLIVTNAKNFGAVALGETAEEGVQQISEMGITQIARVNNPEGNIPQYSGSDILKGGVEAAVAAFPASIGLGGMAVGASGLRFTRHAAQLLSLGKERADEALRTQTGVNLLNNLMEAAQDTELGANHKETFNKLMKSNLEGTVHETAYVDSELLLAEEGGDVVFNQLAAAAGYTKEQINTLRETGAPIEINTADVVSTIAGASEINIADYVSFDAADRCFARNQKVAKELNGLLQKVKTEEVERTINNINTLTTEMFGETEERDLATMIIAEFEDPIAGIEERRSEINREISDMIDPVVEEMRGGMGQGVELYATDDYGNIIEAGDGAHIGGAVRLSNNAPWYSKYYKANKKRPSEQELRELAEEVITGNNEYGVGDYDYTDPGMVEYAEETKARLENLRHELELLNNIEPKLKDVNKGDFAALDALSEDGVKVYKAIMDKLRGMPNKAVKSAASMSALIYAHRAETHARAMQLLGNKKYTALDYMASHPVEFGGVERNGYNQIGVDDIPVYTFYTVAITGDELGEYTNLNDLRKKAVEYYKNNLTETTAYNPVLGNIRIERGMTENDILFNAKAKNKMKQTSAKKEKLLAVTHLREIISNANFITESGPYKDSHEMDHFYYLHAKVENDAFKYIIVSVIETKDKTLKLKNFNVFTEDEYKKEMEDALTRGNPSLTKSGQNQRGASSNTSIADEEAVFNQQRVFYQSAWHGSPHVFERFDLGAIGTGEGAQAHGWGLYFAKNREVAKSYRERLSDTLIEYDGEDINILLDSLIRKGDYGKAALIEEVIANGVDRLNSDAKQFIEDEIFSQEDYKWFKKNIENKIKASGSLFEVDVPEDDVLLDEDLSFEEQPEKVKEAIYNILGEGKMLDEQEFLEGLDLQGIREAIGFFTEAHLDFETSYLYDELKEDLWTLASELYNSGNVQEAKSAITEKLKEQLDLWVEENGIDADVNFTIDTILEMIGNEIIKELIEYQNKDYSQMNGYQLYDKIADIAGGHKQASLILNENGVKGIAYDGAQDGRCFVVFDDKAIAVINRFNQAAGQNAENANLAALQEAMAMSDNYEDAKTIYEKTGWYRGADGKWRFDIPDNLDKIDASKLRKSGMSTLGDVYDNPVLYKAYPWLAGIIVAPQRMGDGALGKADARNGVIYYNADMVDVGKTESLTIGDITYTRNNFSVSGITDWESEENVLQEEYRYPVAILAANYFNIDMAIDSIKEGLEKSQNTLEELKQKDNVDQATHQIVIQKVQESIEDKLANIKMLNNLKAQGITYKSVDKTNPKGTHEKLATVLIHEIQHIIQHEEDFAMGGNTEAVNHQIHRQIVAIERKINSIHEEGFSYLAALDWYETAIFEDKPQETIEHYKRVYEEYKEKISEEEREELETLNAQRNRLRRETYGGSSYDKYYRLHGEQEARSASKKAEINTERERLNSKEVRSLDAIRDEYLKKIDAIYHDYVYEWLENFNLWGDENANSEETANAKTRMDEIEEGLGYVQNFSEFVKEVKENDELAFNKD
ncbi:MAG: hypothetical protein IIV46_03545, partial [Phascolarctobacterium sp.]|nr:hypothetical protein [Phascolarctobacterium sp.]